MTTSHTRPHVAPLVYAPPAHALVRDVVHEGIALLDDAAAMLGIKPGRDVRIHLKPS